MPSPKALPDGIPEPPIYKISAPAFHEGQKLLFQASWAGIPVATVSQGALVVCALLVPLFVWYVREEGDAWVTNAFVSTLGFPFWAYALGATAFNDYWDGNLAAILLATFTVVSGLISPRTPRAKRREQRASAPPRTERPHLDLIEPNTA